MEENSFLNLPLSLWRNTVFVSSITFFNALFFGLAIVLWMINRQTQIRPSKSQSRPEAKNKNVRFHEDGMEKENTMGVKKPSDLSASMNLSGSDQDLFSEDWGRGKSRAKLIKNFSMDFDVDEDDDDDEDDNYCWDGDNEFDDKNAPSFDADEDEDEGEDEDSLKDNIAPDADRSNTTTARAMSNPQFLTMKKEMLHFVSKMSIFSYLSDDAFKECLIHMRYIDLPQSGSAIAYTNLDTDSQPSNTDNTEIDGSLYVVISGAVDCSCQLVDREINKMNDDHCDSSKSQHAKLQFTAGPGDLVTSQLAMISDLVRLYQQEKNDADMGTPRSIHPVRVNAHTSTPNTRLICVPSHAFLSVLKKFPHEVHQLTQTILGRTQRVTLQTLVKSLGLTNEIMSRTDRTLNDKMICSQQRNSDLKHQFQMCQQECRNMCNDEKLQLDTSNEVTALKVPNEIKRIVATAAAWQLGGDSDENIHILEKHSSIIAVQPGSVLVRAGGRSEYVYFVVEGEIEVGNFITKGLSKNSTRYLGFSITGQSFNANIKTDGVAASFQVSHLVHSGAILSEMSTFVGEVSMLTSRASSQLQYPSLLLQISKSTYFSLLHRNTTVLIQSLSSILKNDFSPMVHLLDWGLKWRDVQAGSILAEKGEPCGSLWVVLNGRLRSGTKHEGNAVMKHEYGRGACIGDVQVLTGDEWPNDVYAIRNSELAELPVHVLEFIMHMFPSCGVHFARIIANQVQQRYMKKDKFALNKSDNGLPSYKLSVATVAIIPVCFRSNHDSALKFCENVISSLEKIAPCALMTKALVKKKLGKVHNVKNFSHDLKLSRLLGDLEENNRLVAFQAEPSFNWWTKICIQQSDCVLLVVDSEKAPECARLQRYLSLIQGTRLTKRVEMVILSKEEKDGIEGVKPISKELKEWIERLPFNTTNHLIRLLKTKADIINKNDMNRMCRRITGCSLGLVLGGGGARGIAHLGVIKALLEAGVQVDLVGGSSQGAFIGALYAKYPDNFDKLLISARLMADRMSSMQDKFLDLTFPLVSYFDGRRFNSVIKECIGEETMIENLIMSFFCVSTNLCQYGQEVHTKGSCWKYVRASMSLHGYLPPISENGSLLLDGGYTSIVPNDVMSTQIGARAVIAVDVSREEMPDYYEYGSHLSGFWLLYNSLNPWTKTVRIPSMGELSQKLIWANSAQKQKNLADDCDLFLAPPVQTYGTLDYHLFDEIYELGYNYTKHRIEDFLRDAEYQWILSK